MVSTKNPPSDSTTRQLTRHQNISTRLVLLLLPFLVVPNAFSQQGLQTPKPGNDRVIIKPRTIVIVRHGEFVKDFPGKQRATVKYPLISGLSDPGVLRRVRSILQIKNVFDSSIAEYRDDNWLEEFSYKVNYNKNYILDLTFRQEGSGAYPDSQEKHFAIDLKKGTTIKAADAFVAAQLNTLLELLRERLRAELKQILIDLGESKSDPEDIRISKEAQEALEYKLEDVDQFEISDKGITFLYDAGYPHVIQAFEPEGRYFFTYAEMKPFIKRDGPLGQFIH